MLDTIVLIHVYTSAEASALVWIWKMILEEAQSNNASGTMEHKWLFSTTSWELSKLYWKKMILAADGMQGNAKNWCR